MLFYSYNNSVISIIIKHQHQSSKKQYYKINMHFNKIGEKFLRVHKTAIKHNTTTIASQAPVNNNLNYVPTCNSLQLYWLVNSEISHDDTPPPAPRRRENLTH